MISRLKIRLKPLLAIYTFCIWHLIKKRGERREAKSNNVLIILSGPVGDSIVFVPLIKELSKKYGMHIYCKKSLGELFYYSKLNLKLFYEEERTLKNILKVKKFKHVILATFTLEHEREVLETNNLSVLRFPGHSVFPLHLRKVSVISPPVRMGHPVTMIRSYFKFFGLDTKNITPDRYPATIELRENKVKKTLEEFGTGKKYAVISASSVHQRDKNFKFPSEEKLANIADYMIDKYGYKVILTGLKQDSRYYSKIIDRSKMKKNVISLAGRTSIAQLAAILKKASLLIAIDSGAVHIAATQNTPTISIIRKSVKDIWFPWMDKDNYRLIPCEDNNLDSSLADSVFKHVDYFLGQV